MRPRDRNDRPLRISAARITGRERERENMIMETCRPCPCTVLGCQTFSRADDLDRYGLTFRTSLSLYAHARARVDYAILGKYDGHTRETSGDV